MIEGYEDAFVGSVAIGLGIALLAGSLLNSQRLYALRSSRWLEALFARTGARLVHAVLGCGLIALGCAITQGFRWRLLG
jgi:hypothetical protein